MATTRRAGKRRLDAQADDGGQTKRVHVIAKSIPSTAAPSGSCLFFERLNLDVRNTIYDFLYEHLPPLCLDVTTDCRGFILSCKQAKEEIEGPAAQHLSIFIAGFIKEYNGKHDAKIHLKYPILKDRGFDALKNITLAIPLYDFDMERFWPLLLKPFDRITFYVDGSELTTTKHPGSLKFDVASLIKQATIDLCRMIEDGTYTSWQVRDLSALQKFKKGTLPEPRERDYSDQKEYQLAKCQWDLVNGHHMTNHMKHLNRNVKRKMSNPAFGQQAKAGTVSLAWNFRQDADISREPMTGTVYRYDKYYKDEQARWTYLSPDDVDWSYRFDVKSVDGLIGEAGMVSHTRWDLLRFELLCNLDGTVPNMDEEAVGTVGLGNELVNVYEMIKAYHEPSS